MSNEPTASDPPPLAEQSYPAYYVDPQTGYFLPYAQDGWNERRLHPATIIVRLAKFLRSIAILIAIAIFTRASGRSAGHVEIVAGLLGTFGVAGAVFKYLSFRYSIVDGALQIRSGIIQRQDRVIPIERIQNINLRQELVHRLLGVVDVHIETAGGGGAAEAELSVVSLADAEALRAALSQRNPSNTAMPLDHVADAAPAPEIVYRATLVELILAGATTNRLGTLVAGVLGLLVTSQAFLGREFRIEQIIQRSAARLSMPAWTTVALAIVALVAIGWLASIAMSVVGRFGFRITRVHGQLERSFGLITKHHSIFPVQRVQMLMIRSPLFQRWLGLCHVSAETAGSFRDSAGQGRRGEQQGTSELCPILRTRRADAMCRLALPTFSYDAIAWRRTSSLARWRDFVRTTTVLAILVAAGALTLNRWIWIGLAVIPIVALLTSLLYYRAIGYAVQNDFLATRRGVLTRTIRVVPFAKVQASFVTQSPLQLKLKLATLKILTAGAGFGANASIPDLPLRVAVELQDLLQSTSHPVTAAEPENAVTAVAE